MQVLSNMTLLFQARCGLVLVLLSIVQCIVQQLREETYVNMQSVDCIRTRQLSSTEKDKAIFVFNVFQKCNYCYISRMEYIKLMAYKICLQNANDWETLGIYIILCNFSLLICFKLSFSALLATLETCNQQILL